MVKFLEVLFRLVQTGAIKKVDQALKFAKNEFGEITPLIRKQIDKVFKDAKKPTVGKSTKKEGEVVPFKKKEGIMATEEASPLMKRLDDVVDMLQKNPKRPGGPLDPATGLTRTAVREILTRQGIKITKGMDPIEVFRKTFGQDVLGDVANLSEELLEMEKMGRTPKKIDTILQEGGFFDIKPTKNPPQGMTDNELTKFIKKTDQETTIANKRMLDEDEIAELDMDIGGLEYTNDFDGTVGSANKLRKEHKQYIADMELEYKKGNLDPVAGDKSPARKRFLEKKLEEMEMSGDTRLMTRDEIEELSSFDLGTEMDKAVKKFNDETLENSIILNNFNPKGRKPNATGGRVRAASGGLADLLKL